MGGSFGSTIFGVIALSVLLGVARVVWFAKIMGGSGRKMARIVDSDAHLSFDERIAERMRELDREKALSTPLERAPVSNDPLMTARDPAAAPARPTFGRRAG